MVINRRIIYAIHIVLLVLATFTVESQDVAIADTQHPTAFEYATISLLTYETANQELRSQLLALGWEVFLVTDSIGNSDSIGYFGISFVNHKTEQIVVAHRGVQIDEIITRTDYDDAWDIFMERPSEQFLESATEFEESVRRKTRFQSGCEGCKDLLSYRISHTGHSLGAVMAELFAAQDGLTAVTFESPGSSTMATDIPNGTNILTYVGEPNAINTVNEHIGEMILVKPDWIALRDKYYPLDYPLEYDTDEIAFDALIDGSSVSIPNNSVDLLEVLLAYSKYTLEAHNMRSIWELFDMQNDFQGGVSVAHCWPVGIEEGLRNFLEPEACLDEELSEVSETNCPNYFVDITGLYLRQLQPEGWGFLLGKFTWKDTPTEQYISFFYPENVHPVGNELEFGTYVDIDAEYPRLEDFLPAETRDEVDGRGGQDPNVSDEAPRLGSGPVLPKPESEPENRSCSFLDIPDHVASYSVDSITWRVFRGYARNLYLSSRIGDRYVAMTQVGNITFVIKLTTEEYLTEAIVQEDNTLGHAIAAFTQQINRLIGDSQQSAQG